MGIHSLSKCFFLLSLIFAASLCYADHKTFEVVGYGQCADCNNKFLKTAQAFSGLGVTIDCKLKNGETKRVGAGELDNEGKFVVSLPQEVVEDGKTLKEECYAQLHSAAATPCPAHNDLESSKIEFKSESNDKATFGPTKTIQFSAALCTSKFFWPYFKYPPLPSTHPWLKHFGHPWLIPPMPSKILPPPTPVYEPPPTPVYEPPPTPVYEPPPTPVYKPSPTPVYKPHPPPTPVYKPSPVPVYKPKPPVHKPPKKPCPPVYKPPVEKPPVYKPPVEKPPVYKPPVYKPPVYKPPVYKPPVYKPPVYKPPVYKPPVYTPPITKKPCPPLPKLPPIPNFPPKYFHHPKYGHFPPLPPHIIHP